MVFVISHLATEIAVYLRNWCGLLRIWILLSFDGPEWHCKAQRRFRSL